MSDNFEIRFVEEHDLSQLLELIQEFAGFEKLDHILGIGEASLRSALFGEGSFCNSMVVESSRKLIGYSIFYPVFRSFSGIKVLYLEDLYIQSTFRGNGVGSNLLKAVCEYSIRNGFERIDFQVLDWNENAIQFYESLGAVRVNENEDFTLTRKALDDLIK